MSEREPHNVPPSESERAAQDAVRALARPQAEASFRERLRHDFTTGRIGQRRSVLASAVPWWTRARVLVPLAAGVLIVAGVLANRGPDWRMASADGDGHVTVDGTVYLPGDPVLAARLERGGRVRVDGALTLDLVAPGVAAVALAPGSEVQLSSAPGRWWSRQMRARVEHGDVYFTTGRAFHGAHLDVSTPQVDVRAVGTAFAVLCEPGGTCVCVMEGRVRVGEAGSSGAATVEVPQGMRRVVHADHTSETLTILDDSVHRLHRQREATGSLLGR